MDETKRLATLIKEIDRAGITSREQWHEWKRGQTDLLCKLLDYQKQEGMPDVTQVMVPHFHRDLPLIGLNYTPAAGISLHHYRQGWSSSLRACRGSTFARDGSLVARGFPKFQNFGEIGGSWPGGDDDPEVTIKEDGHLIIVFRYKDKVIAKTRGEFHSPTAILANEMIRADLVPHWMEMDFKDITVLCELIHPETKVQVDYGDRQAMILIGLYDNATGIDLPIDELRKAADAFGLECVRQVDMNREDLMQVIHGGGNNAEGFVARWPDGYRVKFKYGGYVDRMKEERASRRQQPERLDATPSSRPGRREKPMLPTAPWLRRP